MNEAGDIVAVSVPFTAGIAAGTLVMHHLENRTMWCAASAVLVLCGIVWFGMLYGRSGHGHIVLLFLSLGLLCSITSGMCLGGATGRGWLTGLLSGCAESFKREIEVTEFPHDSTKSLVCAFLTGDRGGLTSIQVETFRNSGASHILALSGLHLGVIYMAVDKLLSIAGNSIPARTVRSTFVVLLSGFYTLMTGAGPSIVRAFLFILLNETGKLSPERKRSTVRTLLAALTIQLGFNPSVISSLGFQLSYLAMTGIALFFPKLSSWYPRGGKHDPVRWVWESLSMSVSCQILTAPLVWIRFRTFPRYFLITNLLALPLTTIIMTASAAAIALHALGICPGCLLMACDMAVQTLYFILECISGMQTAV